MKLLVHAGVNKAASTSIQAWLLRNREMLKSASVIYPRPIGDGRAGNAGQLLFCLRHDHWRSIKLYISSLSEQAKTAGVNKVVISSEGLVQLLLDEVKWERFISLCHDVGFEHIETMVFLRPAAPHCISAYCHRAHLPEVPDFSQWLANGTPLRARGLPDGLEAYEYWYVVTELSKIREKLLKLGVSFFPYTQSEEVMQRFLALDSKVNLPSENRSITCTEAYILSQIKHNGVISPQALRERFLDLSSSRNTTDRCRRYFESIIFSFDEARSTADASIARLAGIEVEKFHPNRHQRDAVEPDIYLSTAQLQAICNSPRRLIKDSWQYGILRRKLLKLSCYWTFLHRIYR